MRWAAAAVLFLSLIVAAHAQTTAPAAAGGLAPSFGPSSAPAPAPVPQPAETEAASTETATAPPFHPPKPSAATWFSWLPEDPMLLAGVIISLLSGCGFLFVIWTVFFELIVGPFCMTVVDACQKRK